MKELQNDEMKAINGGLWWIPEILLAGLVKELITEGFKKCFDDFAAGIESTQKH
jgi:bacteriocin-like protein